MTSETFHSAELLCAQIEAIDAKREQLSGMVYSGSTLLATKDLLPPCNRIGSPPEYAEISEALTNMAIARLSALRTKLNEEFAAL